MTFTVRRRSKSGSGSGNGSGSKQRARGKEQEQGGRSQSQSPPPYTHIVPGEHEPGNWTERKDVVKGAEEGRGVGNYLTREQRVEELKRRMHMDDFAVAVTDDKGHAERLQVRIHPAMFNYMSMLVARNIFPFPTVSHLIRAAVVDYMRKLYLVEAGADPLIPNNIPHLEAINRIAREVEQNMEFRRSLDSVRVQIRELTARGHEKQAVMFLADVLEKVKAFSDKAWKAYYTDALKSEFGHLFKKLGKSVNTFPRFGE